MNDIGGNVCIRDGTTGDFCWREAVQSLLPICDSVTICDGGSTDGTLEAIQEWMTQEPRIRLIHYPWPNPKGMLHFWVTWLNWCREQIPHFWHLQLDADEVLFESSYEWIEGFTRTKREESARMTRLNFWRDHRHLLPHGHVCGHIVMRLAPQSLWMPTDYPHPQGERLCQVSCPSPAQIGHYGFIRKRDGYFVKQRRYQGWVHDSYDPRCAKAEEAPNHLDSIADQCGWGHLIEKYHGPHPEAIKPWLRERGFSI